MSAAPYGYDEGGKLRPMRVLDAATALTVVWLTPEQAEAVLRARRLLFGDPAQ